MANKYTVKSVSFFEFDTKDEAEAFVDFKQASEAEIPECTSAEVQLIDSKQTA